MPSAAEGALASLHSRVLAVREGHAPPSEVEGVWREVRRGDAEDWLLPLELRELAHARRLAPGLREAMRGGRELRARPSPEVDALVAQRIAELS